MTSADRTPGNPPIDVSHQPSTSSDRAHENGARPTYRVKKNSSISSRGDQPARLKAREHAASRTSLNIKGSLATLDHVSAQDLSGKFTARQKLYLITIVIAKFVHQLCTFWGAMVYPIEARARGFSGLEIGLMIIFVSVISWFSSIYLSTSFLKFGGKHAAYNLFVSGSLCYGMLTIVVATCAMTQHKYLFGALFTLLFALRGMAQASLFSAINTILLSDEFKDHVSVAKAMDTMAYTLGSIFSFALSGFIYQQAGFAAVVMVLGGFQSMISLTYFFMLPRSTSFSQSDAAIQAKTNFTLVKELLLVPEIVTTLLSHCVTYFSLFYLAPFFTPYVASTFRVSASVTGLIACLPYLSMSVFGSVWSMVANTRRQRQFCLLLGAISFGVATAFAGPDPLIWDEPSLISLSVVFFVGGGLLVSNLVLNTPELRDCAEDFGFDSDNLTVSATLASLLTSFEFLGDVLGPPTGGVVADVMGVPRAFTVGGLVVLVVAGVRMAVFAVDHVKFTRRMNKLKSMPSSMV